MATTHRPPSLTRYIISRSTISWGLIFVLAVSIIMHCADNTLAMPTNQIGVQTVGLPIAPTRAALPGEISHSGSNRTLLRTEGVVQS